MYLPLSLSLTNPYFTQWIGKSGKKYEFGVVGAEQQITLDQPVVFVFAKHAGPQAEVLYIGHGKRFSLTDNHELASAWLSARELGMTHLHLRFDAVWDDARESETADLVAGHRPPINEQCFHLRKSDGTQEETARLYYFPNAAGQASANLERSLRNSGAMPSSTLATLVENPAEERNAPARSRTSLLATVLQRAARLIDRLTMRRRPLGTMPVPHPVSISHDEVAPFVSLSVVEDASMAHRLPEDATTMVDAAEVGRLDFVSGGDATDTRHQTVDNATQGADEEAIGMDEPAALDKMMEVRARLSLAAAARVYLYAGDFSYQDGIDILTEALITVCRTDERAYFLLVGSGELRGPVEETIFGAGLRARCCLPGDLSAGDFADFLGACDYVVIPAREPRGAQLADLALSLGKPILTTHQAKITGVVHGQHGLVAYDNPNSLVWGLRELPSIAWNNKPVTWTGDREREVA